MNQTSAAYSSSRAREVESAIRGTEARSAFYDRVLDGVRKFLQDHAMQGKTGAREFYDFEKTLHERMLQAEREVVAEVMAASDVDADAIEIEGRVHRRVVRRKKSVSPRRPGSPKESTKAHAAGC